MAAAAPAPAATTTADPAPAVAAPQTGVVFIGKIPATCNKDKIKEFLTPIGAVKRVVVKKPRHLNNVVFAFAEFEDPAKAPEAIEKLNGKELEGGAVVVEAARNQFPKRRFPKKRKGGRAPSPVAPAAGAAGAKGRRAPPRRRRNFNRRRPRRNADAPLSKDVAYVGNLPYIVDEEHMKDIFEGCKFVEARVVRRARDNRSKGFGFVTFASEEDRKHAIELVNGSVVEGRKIHVSPARERVERPKKEETAPAAAAPAAAAPAPAAAAAPAPTPSS